jgi:hypothetical protein
MKKITLYFIIPFLVLSCRSGSREGMADYKAGSPVMMADIMPPNSTVPPPPPPQSDESQALTGTDQSIQPVETVTRKIIRDGNMEIRVSDLEKGKAAIDTLTKKFKGYYNNESYSNADYSKGYSVIIRVPADNFDAFIAAIESGMGEVVFKNISSRDVTEQFIDLEARMANKKNYLSRYSELLKQARTVKDMLEIEEKTRVIEEEIESTEGRLKYLQNQVDYSTLSLTISKKNDYNVYSNSNQGSFFDRLKISLVKGWFGLVSFVLFVIRIWPFWLIAGCLFWLIRKFIKRKKKS